MSNLIMDQLNRQNQTLNGMDPQQIKQAWNSFQSLANPKAMIMQKNPLLGALLSRGSAKDAFFALAKQKGIDPNTAMTTIQNMLK